MNLSLKVLVYMRYALKQNQCVILELAMSLSASFMGFAIANLNLKVFFL